MSTPLDFRVDFDGLDLAAGHIATASRDVEAQLHAMDRALAPLRADWTGSASDAYAEAKRNWTKSIVTMNGLLESLGKAVEASRTGYAEAEQANLGRW